MNIIRYIFVIILSTIIGFFAFRFYDNFSESSEINTFLEEAYVVSSLHQESAKKYSKLINFDELNRDEFESTFIEIIRDAQEANNILINSESSYTGAERELLEIATTSWLKGLETFQVSILNLVDQEYSQLLEESIAESITSLSVGDKAYSNFLSEIRIKSDNENLFLPDFFNIEYTGIESNAYQFAELIVDRAIENKSGLFLRRDISVTGVEFVPESIAITEEGYRVLLDQPTSLQLVIANEGNVEETEVLVLILVTDESGDTVYEKRTKLNTIGPFESKSYFLDPLEIEKGILYEWFILVEEVENEEDFEDNIYSVKAFIPPED
ncbi:hypothetical protein OAY19_02510 [Acidimicrobiaceae bacterium]|nr:hypothetical protein [Acidimicrobiaceae bacterium]